MFNIILLGITSLLTDISSEMVYPLLPVYLVSVLGASPAVLGLIEGAAESLASLTKVFSGYFSDRIKKRKIFAILGYSGSALGKVFIYVAANWGFVFAGRIIDRFGKGLRTAPRDALIAESCAEKKRGAAFGLHRAMDTLGAAIGVLLAYSLVARLAQPDQGAMRRVFLFSLIPAILGVLLLFFVSERQKGKEIPERKPPRFKWSALDKKLKLFLAFSFIFTLGNSSNQFLLLRARNLGSPLGTIVLLYLFYNIVYALVSYPAARMSDKIGRKKLLVAGYLFYGLVYLGFALNNSSGNLWFLFGLYGLYIGFTEGVEKALIVDIAPVDLRATAIGLHAAAVGFALFPASLLAGALWSFFGAQSAFYFGSLMGFLAAIGIWLVLVRD